jgi:hypothetical protein
MGDFLVSLILEPIVDGIVDLLKGRWRKRKATKSEGDGDTGS